MELSEPKKRVFLIVVAAVIFVAAISFPATYYTYTSNSSMTQTTGTSGISTSSFTNTYASTKEICAELPKTAIGSATANPNATHVYFLIIEVDLPSSYAGINGSYYHVGVVWPVLTVYQGQQVTIHVLNCPSSFEPHGFAIGNYFAGGVTLSPGQSYTLNFVANTVGRYTVFCNVFCAIHQFMQNGELLVKPMPSG